jgi:hypothetical protein
MHAVILGTALSLGLVPQAPAGSLPASIRNRDLRDLSGKGALPPGLVRSIRAQSLPAPSIRTGNLLAPEASESRGSAGSLPGSIRERPAGALPGGIRERRPGNLPGTIRYPR